MCRCSETRPKPGGLWGGGDVRTFSDIPGSFLPQGLALTLVSAGNSFPKCAQGSRHPMPGPASLFPLKGPACPLCLSPSPSSLLSLWGFVFFLVWASHFTSADLLISTF